MRESRRSRVVLGVLLLVAFTFLAIDLRADATGPLGGVKRVTGNLFGPLESFISAVTSPVRGFVTSLTSSGDRDAQVASLEAEIARLRATGASPDTTRRLAELNGLLRMSRDGGYRMVPAQVIAIGPAQGFAWTVTIDSGKKDGIAPDMTVVAGSGLAGRVVSVSDTSAVVALLVDPTTSVGGRLEGAGEIGFVNGTGSERELEFQLLDPFGPLKAGDRVVTFGSKAGRPYVPGVPIGEITSVTGTPGQLTRLAKIRPFANMSALDVVAVITEPPRTNPRDSVLVPTNAPTETIPVPDGESSAPTATPSASSSPRPTGDGASPVAAR